MRKLLVVLEYLLMLLILTVFWVAMTAFGVMWIGSGHGVLALGENISGNAGAWVMVVVFGYGWLMTLCAGLAFGPRGMLELFREELGPRSF